MLEVKLQYESLIVKLHEKGEIKKAMNDVLKNEQLQRNSTAGQLSFSNKLLLSRS